MSAASGVDSPPWARVVIVDYRSGPHLQRCIDALAVQTDPDFEAVIVDNDCPDGAARRLDLPDDRFNVLRSDTNLGYAGGSNLGATDATSPWLIMLNPDTIPATDWLEELKVGTRRHSDAAMFGTTLLKADAPSRLDGFGDVLSIYGIAWRGGTGARLSDLPSVDYAVFGPCGAGALYRRDVFEDFGGFRESFFCYLEDVDLAWRIGQSGGRCVQLYTARARHVGGASTQGSPEFSLYHSARNGIWMIWGSAPLYQIAPMMVLATLARLYLILRGSYGTSRNAVLKGLRDGWIGLPRQSRAVRRGGILGDRATPQSRPVWSLEALRQQKVVGRPIRKTQ